MEATGVFSSCVTALMKASCCSLRLISRTRKVVLSTTPLMMVRASIVARNRRIPVRQLSRTQPMYSRMMTEIRPTPRAMKKAMDLRRPATTILSAYRSAFTRVATTDSQDGRPCPAISRAVGEAPGPMRPARRSALRGFALGYDASNFRHANRFRQAEELQHLDGHPGNIEFVPSQPVPRRRGMGVMVVVPAFAERQQSDPPKVPGIVTGLEPAAAPHVGGGVHCPGGMQAESELDEGTPQQER